MTEQNANAAGCLGRLLTFIGMIWIGLILLAGAGILSRLGMRGDLLATVVGTGIIPGLFLLGAGRVLRRRATAMGGEEGPQGSTPVPDQERRKDTAVRSIRLEPTPHPTPTPPIIPVPGAERTPPKPVQPRPKPVDPIVKARRDVAKSLDEVASRREDLSSPTQPTVERSARPKTSQELVDEARRRWGVDKPR
jgi:hypothetical protein